MGQQGGSVNVSGNGRYIHRDNRQSAVGGVVITVMQEEVHTLLAFAAGKDKGGGPPRFKWSKPA